MTLVITDCFCGIASGFFEKALNNKLFKWYRTPNLICCTKWKYDYVCAIRVADECDNASVF